MYRPEMFERFQSGADHGAGDVHRTRIRRVADEPSQAVAGEMN